MKKTEFNSMKTFLSCSLAVLVMAGVLTVSCQGALSQVQIEAFCEFSQGWCENCSDPCEGECGAVCNKEQTSIIAINASNKSLSEIPQSFSNLNTLETLDVSNNMLNDIPSFINDFKSLSTLNFDNNFVECSGKTGIVLKECHQKNQKVCMSISTKETCDNLKFCYWNDMFGCTPYTKSQQITQMILAILLGVGVYGAVIVMRIMFSRTDKRDKARKAPIN